MNSPPRLFETQSQPRNIGHKSSGDKYPVEDRRHAPALPLSFQSGYNTLAALPSYPDGASTIHAPALLVVPLWQIAYWPALFDHPQEK